jgi:hypothetical protein
MWQDKTDGTRSCINPAFWEKELKKKYNWNSNRVPPECRETRYDCATLLGFSTLHLCKDILTTENDSFITDITRTDTKLYEQYECTARPYVSPYGRRFTAPVHSVTPSVSRTITLLNCRMTYTQCTGKNVARSGSGLIYGTIQALSRRTEENHEESRAG